MRMLKNKILAVLLSLLLSMLFLPQNTYAFGAPAAPSDVKATAVSAEQIDLSWAPVSDASQYYIYRSNASSGTYTYVGTVNATSFSNSGLSAATPYYYKVQAINSLTSSPYSAEVAAVTLTSAAMNPGGLTSVQSERYAGADRYATSAEIAKRGWTTSDYAILANGEVFPDALCAAPLSAKFKAPILLTGKDKLDEQTKYQLSNLKVKKIFLIGGLGVLPAKIEQEIIAMGIGVERIAGADRYETSLKLAKLLGDFSEAVIATGENFPDALSIAPIAAAKGIPILLTPKDNISAALKEYLADKVQKTYAVGAAGVISTAVFNQLPFAQRLSGENRYETNIRIIKEFSQQLDLSTSYLATGLSFPDALSGAALAALTRSPVILVSDPLDPATAAFMRENSALIKKGVAFGGSGVISESLLTRVLPVSAPQNSGVTPPANVTAATLSTSQIILNWDAVSSATAYNVYRAVSVGGEYAFVSAVNRPGYTDGALAAGTQYYYKVQAVNAYGAGANSAAVQATTFANAGLPSVPLKLAANVLANSKIYLTWNAVDNATAYIISRTQWVGASYQEIATVTTPSFTDYVASELTYFYKVQAVNSAGKSAYSNSAYALTFSKNSALAAPSNVMTRTASNNSIYLSWGPVTDVTYYNVYRLIPGQKSFDLVAQIDKTFHYDSGLEIGTSYIYKVQAVNSSGVSEDSTVVQATTLFRTN